MKKTISIFALAAILFTAAVSCSKETDDPTQNQEQTEEPAVTPEQPADLPEGMIQLTFSVNPEETKTSWDGTTHGWSEGDQVRILWGEGESDFVDAAVENGQVTAVVADVDTYYAVYPASAAGDFVLNSDGTIDVAIPKIQDGTFASANKMVARSSKEAALFAFKNVTHILKLHITAATYDRFEFSSNENAKLITDVIGVTFGEDNNVTFGAATTSYTTFGEGYTHSKYTYLNNVSANTDYYLALTPGANLSTGFGVKAHIAGDPEETYNLGALSKKAIETDNVTTITNLGNLDEMIHADWFIQETASGKKDGSSWENAGDLTLFLKLFKEQTNDKGVNSTWRLKNAKIHFAEGTYNIEAANGGSLTFQSSAWDNSADDKYKVKNTTVIDGGYPASNTGTSLSGKDAVSHPTKWICNQAANNDRIFYANGCKIYDLTFDSITFTTNPEASNYNTRGVAFFFNAATSGKVLFKDCIFSELKAASTNGGGAIDFNSTGELEVTFEHCSFLNNEATSTSDSFGGGAIVVEQGASTAINIIGCTADGNKSTSANGHGGFIHQKGGVINISDNTVIKNTSAVKRGGAIWTNATLNVENTTFESNTASNGGAIHTQAGSYVFIVNSTFTGNKATNGASIRSEGTDGALATLLIFNCLFNGNNVTGTGNQGGFDVQATSNYSRVLLANSTLCKLTGNAALGTNSAPNFNVVSCTFNENTADFNRNFNNGKFYNCILASGNPTAGTNLQKAQYYSIYGDYRYGAGGTTTAVETESGLGATCLGTFSNGVYPLNSAKSASYGAGMSVADIQALTFNNITLTEEQKALLAKDQKGNDRTGTIMGAYVLTE